MRVTGKVVTRNLPQFDVDFAVSVRGFYGQRGVWREFEGFATGGEAYQRCAVAGVDSAFNRRAEFHVVLGGEFGIDFEGVFGLPLAGVAEFIASVAAFAFGRGGDADVLFPVLQRLGEDGVIEFKADTRFVLVVVAVDATQVEGKTLAQIGILFALLFAVLAAQFVESSDGKGDAVAVVAHDGFVEGEGVVNIGALRATHIRRSGKQGAVGGFLRIIAAATAAFDESAEQFGGVLQAGIGFGVWRSFLYFAVFGTGQPGADVVIGEFSDRTAAFLQILVDISFGFGTGGCEGFIVPTRRSVGGENEGGGDSGSEVVFEVHGASCWVCGKWCAF